MRLEKYYAAAPEIDSREIDYLIAEILGHKSPILPLAEEPSPADSRRILAAIQKLKAGVPAQYISGYAYFYGLQLAVSPAVLIPRFDTEPLVEVLLKYLKPKDRVLEIGCGSGAIAIALKHEMPSLKLHATDISALALRVARRNAQKHQTEISFYRADLFPPLCTIFNAIVSNPPYISEKDYAALDSSVRDYEPATALLAKEEGLYFYRRILAQAAKYLPDGGILAFEHGYDQQEALERLTEYAGYKTLEKGKDLGAKPRFLILQKRGNNG